MSLNGFRRNIVGGHGNIQTVFEHRLGFFGRCEKLCRESATARQTWASRVLFVTYRIDPAAALEPLSQARRQGGSSCNIMGQAVGGALLQAVYLEPTALETLNPLSSAASHSC